MGEELQGPPRNSSWVPKLKELQGIDCVSEELAEISGVPQASSVVNGVSKEGRHSCVYMATM